MGTVCDRFILQKDPKKSKKPRQGKESPSVTKVVVLPSGFPLPKPFTDTQDPLQKEIIDNEKSCGHLHTCSEHTPKIGENCESFFN